MLYDDKCVSRRTVKMSGSFKKKGRTNETDKQRSWRPPTSINVTKENHVADSIDGSRGKRAVLIENSNLIKFQERIDLREHKYVKKLEEFLANLVLEKLSD